MFDIQALLYCLYDRAFQHQRRIDAIVSTEVPNLTVRRLIILENMTGPTGFNLGMCINAYNVDTKGKTEQDFANYLYDNYDFYAFYSNVGDSIRFFACTMEEFTQGIQRKPLPF